MWPDSGEINTPTPDRNPYHPDPEIPATYTIKLRCTNCNARNEYPIPFGVLFQEPNTDAGSRYTHPTETTGDTFMGIQIHKKVLVDCTACGLAKLVRNF